MVIGKERRDGSTMVKRFAGALVKGQRKNSYLPARISCPVTNPVAIQEDHSGAYVSQRICLTYPYSRFSSVSRAEAMDSIAASLK